MKYLSLLFFIPFIGFSQSYKLVDKDYPEIVMKKIENDTVGAKLITSKSIIDGYVVYRQIKRLDTNKVYRFPESFLNSEKKPEKNVLYYEAEKIDSYYHSVDPNIIFYGNETILTPSESILELPSNIKIE